LRMKFIGDRDLFPHSIRSLCEKIEKETADGTALEVNFLLCYGGRQEIVDTAKRIAKKVASGELTENQITPELFENNLWTAGSPSPDLIIRTGAQRRLSNFLSYQCVYSELYFLDCMWPNISHQDLQAALIYYDSSKKNFGS
jgi:undecaprenyl diphosphate synthase